MQKWNPDEESQKWLKTVAERSGTAIQKSEVFASVFTKNFMESPQTALELGIAILLDKPIYLICFDDQPVPKSLEKVALGISRVREGNQEDLDRALRGMHEALDARGL